MQDNKGTDNGRESTVKWLSLPFFGTHSGNGFKKDEQTVGEMDFFQILLLTPL